MNKYVLDASAVLALINGEIGQQRVANAIENGAAISTVNLSEVVSKLNREGIPENEIKDVINLIGINEIDFDNTLAYMAGMLYLQTKDFGLSLGDRACIAMAQYLRVPVITADRIWEKLNVDVEIQVIR